ncbi:hypothetical protein G647_07448 [Cladophialophora carrionii CBS 160.54]|uniref:Sister chromatid cohesion protein Dcc1 n=1 Tax=Cladophialophora carrionii CBS 160.54 TaxID=1279043 RepID=V9D2E8_9EURO|nr:uncharacterized protein G647_07448 [Cladophialophora carrionii CBS 160.54]ETI21104.1 hypothetical protein G647_07448 [Cladophialophora carrionii CBS 160.54]
MASSQSSHFPPVPFSLTVPQQSFRLLELSPELVDVVEAQRDAASKRRRLWFKASSRASASASASTSTRRESSRSIEGRAGEADREGFLHLCSDEKLWAVKQVSTSNSVHITQWISAEEMQRQRQADRDGDGDGDTLMTEAEEHANGDGEATDSSDADRLATASNGGITTIAQVKNILELIEVKPAEGDVDGMLREMVPFCGDAENEDDQLIAGGVSIGASGARLSSGNQSSSLLHYVFENIPAPTKTIFEAMNRLFVFGISVSSGPVVQVADYGQQHQERSVTLFIPTTSLLLKCWRVFMQQCAISEVHLDGRAGVECTALHGLLAEIVDASGSKSNPEADLQTNVIVAILRHLSLDAGDYARYARADNLSIPRFHLPPDSDLDRLLEELPGKDDDANDATTAATRGHSSRLRLDPGKTRDLVGHWMLRSLRGDTQPISLAQFLSQWTDLLPESWTRECDARALVSGSPEWEIGEDAHGEEVLRRCLSSGRDGASNGVQAARVESQARKKGKWHEKFGAQRTAALKK